MHRVLSASAAASLLAACFHLVGPLDIDDDPEVADHFGWSIATGDFDGDGVDDMAVGVPYEDLDGIVDAGAVNVVYGSASGLSSTITRADQFWTQDSPGVKGLAGTGDNFGSALSAGDFNGDGFGDLAIGVPSEDIHGATDAGAVNVIYGSEHGLSASGQRTDQYWRQNTSGVEDTAETSDLFGAFLTVGDFDGDGRADLTVGAYREDVDGVVDAGAVNVIYGSDVGLSTRGGVRDQIWSQESPGVRDDAETGDMFGYGESTSGDFNGDGKDDLAIPVSNEDLAGGVDAGAINVVYGSAQGLRAAGPVANQFWNQDVAKIKDSAEPQDYFGQSLAAGDFNDDGLDDIAISVFYEDIGAIPDAGAVNVIYGTSRGLRATASVEDQFWHQDATDVEDIAEAGDRFGQDVAAADFNGDGADDLAVGVYGEDVGAISNAGAVNVLYGSAGDARHLGLSPTRARPDQFWNQDVDLVEDEAEDTDIFGSYLATGDFDGGGEADLSVGVYDEGIASASQAGAVNTIYGSLDGLSATAAVEDQFWNQDS